MSNETVGTATRMHNVIAGGSAVMNIVVFTAVGLFAFENITYGVFAGVLSGVGSYLFLPMFMRISAVQEAAPDDLPFSEAIARADGNPQLAATGLGLEGGGVLMLAVGFALGEPDLLIGLAIGVGAAVVVALVASVLLGR